VDAAVRVLADRGGLGLTPEAVDVEAGVPPGTTAGLIGTSEDLVASVVDRLVASDGSLWTELGGLTPDSLDAFADRMSRWVELALGRERVSSRARVQLFLAGTQRAALGHHAILDVAAVVLDVLGVRDPATRARSVVDFVSGTVLHHFSVRSDEPFDRECFAAAVRRLVVAR